MNSTEANVDTMLDMAPTTPSWFSRKLRSLVGEKVKTEIDETAGLKKGAVSLILHRGNVPSPTEAIRLAEALSVDPIWLIDERQESLEPVSCEPALSTVTLSDIRDEIEKRYFRNASEFEYHLSRLTSEKLNWSSVALVLLRPHDPASLDPYVERSVRFWRNFRQCVLVVKQMRPMYDFFIRVIDESMRGIRQDSIESTEPNVLLKRLEKTEQKTPAIRAILDYLVVVDESFGGDDFLEKRLRWFWNEHAPYHLARLIDCNLDMPSDGLDELRKSLIGSGHLSDKGEPAQLPNIELMPTIPPRSKPPLW